ncbi:MAG: hypothetical protein JWL81_3048 [Verrucomicrobiales bacterium]|nr:hypothetical protein [Verrucomicrobiales bacterium]
MKILRYKILLVLAIHPALAQPLQAQKLDLQAITPDQLQAWIATTNSGGESAEIVESIFNTGRKELIAKCFEFPVTASAIMEKIIQSPDSPEKDAIVISILRGNSPYFPKKRNPYVGDVRQGSIEPWPVEPFRSVIKKWLPEEKLDESIMNTPEARQLLAAKLEAAIAGVTLPAPAPAETSQPAKPGSTTTPAAVAGMEKHSAPAPSSSPANPPANHRLRWFAGLVAPIAILLLVRWIGKSGRPL